jgi:hypothetical protein
MCVGVDQTRNDNLARAIDHLRMRYIVWWRTFADGLDVAISNMEIAVMDDLAGGIDRNDCGVQEQDHLEFVWLSYS